MTDATNAPTIPSLVSYLQRRGACAESTTWLRNQPDPQTAWDTCQRGDWLLWLLGRLGVPRPRLVLAACACARLVLLHVREGEGRPFHAIETAEAWARGGEGAPTLAQVRNAADAAYAAAAAREKALQKQAEIIRMILEA